MHHFRVANGPWVQLLSSLKAALRNNIRAVTDRDIVIVNFSQDSSKLQNMFFISRENYEQQTHGGSSAEGGGMYLIFLLQS